MKPGNLNAIFSELLLVYENLKAEVLIAEVQEKSELTDEDFVISNKSTFSRPHRRDIINVDPLINKDKLTFNLSRNGIYDVLPEGLFHLHKGDQVSFASQRKAFKDQEQDARKFFAPLENEFFYQRLQIEHNERELLDDFYNLNDDFLIDFWKIDTKIPEDFRIKLIKLLPYSYKIAGDFELTRLSLENLLGEKVTFKRKYVNRTKEYDPLDEKITQDSGLQLGVDSVLSSETSEVHKPILEVTVGPISEKKINNFIKKHENLYFINTFYDYFIPLEIEVDTKFTVTNEQGFLLDPANGPVMGISTQL
jgi:hypothetical protein